MLNIDVNRSADGVERYFDRELAVSDYLMKEPGVWAGRGAERLGLRGPVERAQFVALLRNEDPTCGKRLTARMNTSRQENGETVSNRQVGYGWCSECQSRSAYTWQSQPIWWLRRSQGRRWMKRCGPWRPRCSARSENGVWTKTAEPARCCIRSSSIAIPGRLTG